MNKNRFFLYFFRLKTIFFDKLTCMVLITLFLLFLILVKQLSLSAQEKSSIPIGLVLLDQSESARLLAEDVKKVPSLYVYEGEKEALVELLNDEVIQVVFVIKEGYEKSIQIGKTKELITMIYLEENQAVKILSDIFAGEMMYRICLYKSYNLYETLPEDNSRDISAGNINQKQYTREEYIDYTNSLNKSSDYNFSFDITMVDVQTGNMNKIGLDNSLLYLQVIWGMIGMFLSFIAMIIMAGSVLEKEEGIYQRIQISLLHPISLSLSHFFAALTIQGLISFCFVFLLGGNLTGFTFLKGVHLALLMLLYSVVVDLWFVLLGMLIKQVGKYQLYGVAFIMLFGLLGFLNLVRGILSIKLLNISKIIPNSWFINGFIDIILNTSLQDIPYFYYISFVFAAIALSVAIGIISKIKNPY